MPSRVQVETQADSAAREAARRGGPMGFLPQNMRMVPAEQKLQGRERKRLGKGFMAPDIMRWLANQFMRQR